VWDAQLAEKLDRGRKMLEIATAAHDDGHPRRFTHARYVPYARRLNKRHMR